MIDGPPDVMRQAVALHKHLVELPAPVFATAHSIHSLVPGFRSKQRTKPVPPITHRFVADPDPAFVQQVFDIALR